MTPFDREPDGPDTAYLLRISALSRFDEAGNPIFTGPIDRCEGPHALNKIAIWGRRRHGQTVLQIPLFGPVTDYHGNGIYGFRSIKNDAEIMYDIIKDLAFKGRPADEIRYQVLACRFSELMPDSEGWYQTYSVKRAWVCFSSQSEVEATEFIRDKVVAWSRQLEATANGN